ncbi:MAG: zf-TFIIB domain-containing protein [Rubrivivax sp.]|nr:zf-TFIIB domain-containing protein [Rubrivivax sp.]
MPPQPEETPRACPQCRATMAQRRLRAHTGRTVLVDHCAACRLVWFDMLESVQLAGLGWVELLREMSRGEDAWGAQGARPPSSMSPAASSATSSAAASTASSKASSATTPATSPTPAPRPPTLPCPVCAQPLKTVHNRTRWGRFPAQECPAGHGHLHTDAGLLAERGLVRPLLPPERAALRAQKRVLHCLSCGALAEGDSDSDICAWCATPLLVVDLPRLGHALRQRGVDGQPLPPADGVPLRWPCHACGTTLDPTRSPACPQCGAGMLAPAISDLRPLLEAAEHELRAAANHPARPKRTAPPPRTWRDTHLARLWGWIRRE